MKHDPVFLNKVIELLAPEKNENFIDATLGMGGHASLILKKTFPNGKLLALDWDANALKKAKKNLKIYSDRITFENENYCNLKKIIEKNNYLNPKGILFDLGLGSWQLDDLSYGLSFNSNAALDMRFIKFGKSAFEIIKYSSLKELDQLFWEYGDERYSFMIAQAIVRTRKDHPIKTVADLVALVESIKPKKREKIHPATKVLQALRIKVNQEDENLKKALNDITTIFHNVIVIVISFHSGEDRIVKKIFQDKTKYLPIVKKPIVPSWEEIKANPRARSAKLRVAKII